MPEYLSPGVFIEEVPARLKAIEGVSTSTAGMVGEAARGTAAGWLPGVGNANGFQLTPDEAPVLVTSFAQYQRTFGAPPADPATDGYLGHSVRAFFDNGGRRVFIARAIRAGAVPAQIPIDQGGYARLTRAIRPNDTEIFLNSLRSLDTTGSIDIVRSDGTALFSAVGITAYDPVASSITVAAATFAGLTAAIDPSRVAVVLNGAPRNAGGGPTFWARSPGAWGNSLRVLVVNADRPPVAVVTAIGGGGSNIVDVQSAASLYAGAAVMVDDGAGNRLERTVVEVQPGNRIRLDANVSNVAAGTGRVSVAEIDVIITETVSGQTETFRALSWNSDPAPAIRQRHYATIVNQRSRLVFVEPPWAKGGGLLTSESPPTRDNQPMTAFGFTDGPDPTVPAQLGTDGPVPGNRLHVIGVDNGPGRRTGLQSLQDVDDIRLIAAPGETDAAVQAELIGQAERLRYRVAVLDGEQIDPNVGVGVTTILTHRNAYDSSFAAYYSPWVQTGPGDTRLTLPPSGFICGICARTDNERGVWKAPANETVRGAIGLQAYMTTGEQDILNPRGVNVIRRFEGRGIRVWGARTLSSDPEYRYLNVRRFLVFLEASIDRGTQWVVFEPNAPETWSRVTDSVTAFLHTQWRDGALLGRRPEDSFFVRCDETTMTVDDVLNGRLICNIGVAIVRPAEFVIFRIEQIAGLGQQA
jgi:phage tail sheath protein FI